MCTIYIIRGTMCTAPVFPLRSRWVASTAHLRKPLLEGTMSKYSESSWRNACAPIIARVLSAERGGAGLAAALREAYPFGQRKYHPYKIWLDEIARQTGRKPKLGARINVFGRVTAPAEPDPNQGELFNA